MTSNELLGCCWEPFGSQKHKMLKMNLWKAPGSIQQREQKIVFWASWSHWGTKATRVNWQTETKNVWNELPCCSWEPLGSQNPNDVKGFGVSFTWSISRPKDPKVAKKTPVNIVALRREIRQQLDISKFIEHPHICFKVGHDLVWPSYWEFYFGSISMAPHIAMAVVIDILGKGSAINVTWWSPTFSQGETEQQAANAWV